MTKEKTIDALARLMAEQSGADRIEEAELESYHPDDWIAVYDDNRKERYGHEFRKKATRFYERWSLVNDLTENRE